MVEVLLQRLDDDVPVPSYARPDDAGADLVTTVDVSLEPGERVLVPTGIAIALPRGGLSIVNTPGTIDAGYRGEIKVLLVNLDPRQPVHLRRGDRVAQLVVQPVEHARFSVVHDLPPSERGAGGYGSTGGFLPHDRRSSQPPHDEEEPA